VLVILIVSCRDAVFANLGRAADQLRESLDQSEEATRMPDHRSWRVEARLPDGSAGGVHRGQAARLATGLRTSVDLHRIAETDLVVEQHGSVIEIHAAKNSHLEIARRELDKLLADTNLTAEVTVAHRRPRTDDWQTTAGPYHAPRARHGGRGPANHAKPFLSSRAKRRWLIASVLAALAGATLYAVAPGVASTQVGLPLTLPLLFIALVWLHRRLPLAVQWALAIPLALAGPASYLIFSGAQFWAWGQLAVLPLFGLMYDRAFIKRGTTPQSEPWYGGSMQGPYGPP